MPKLWLIFNNEKGEERRVEVDRTPFVVGRHSGCDLYIPDGRLSREHIRIEWQTDRFTIADAGSSNGTTINGTKLADPVKLKNGDVLNLGGGLEVSAELEGAEPPDAAPKPPAEAADLATDAEAPETPGGPNVPGHVPPPVTAAASLGIPTSFFIIAPLLGIFVLSVIIGAVFLLGSDKKEVAYDPDDVGYSTGDNDDPSDADDDPSGTPVPSRSATPAPSNTSGTGRNGPATTPDLPGSSTPAPGMSGETAKVEQNGAAFVRQIAQNDPKAFLTGEQAAKVGAKVKQVGRSSALADNFNSARKNASAIKALAEQKNLKPQFLAVAAITKLGASRGDVLQAAQGIADVYDKLAIHIGSENFDDALLMVAAYDQGAAGEVMKMRNMLQDLTSKSGASAREIRSIWFLEKNGKITPAEYDRALNFLAIGTIAQNPKEFGVNTEALTL